MLSRADVRRAAISLNNCGVTLLSRHLWCEAIETFKDAIRLMKSVANEQGGTVVSEQEMHSALHRAWQGTALAFSKSVKVVECPILKVISSHTDPATFSPEDTKFLVTIDPIDVEDWDSDGTVIESSIILYNFGLAHSCLGSVSGCCLANAKLQDNFYGILQLTHTLAFNLVRKALCQSRLCTPIMLINKLVLVNLMQISGHIDPDASEEYYGSLHELLVLIQAYQKMIPVDDYKFAPAA
jgi:hypothetical protein